MKNKIHISKETCDLLLAAGKKHWIQDRQDQVVAKGKGKLTTFFLEMNRVSSSTTGSSSFGSDSVEEAETETWGLGINIQADSFSEKYQRLIAWNVDILAKSLKDIAGRRQAYCIKADSEEKICALEESIQNNGSLVMDELEEIICLPDWKHSKETQMAVTPELDVQVVQQLHDYMCKLVPMYQEEIPFHNCKLQLRTHRWTKNNIVHHYCYQSSPSS